MGQLRRVEPFTTYLITRRCAQRAFGLLPGALTNQVFLYCLALAARKTGVLVHAVCVMSNHHHLIVTDVHGVMPIFTRELHRLVAKTLNASRGRTENFWEPTQSNLVRIVTDDDVAEHVAYVATNPVAAGLVSNPEEWPGVVAWRPQTIRVKRPTAYFRDEGECPAELTLRLSEPPTREDRSDLPQRVRRAVDRAVAEARRRIKQTGRAFLGRARVMSGSFDQRALTEERRRRFAPAFASIFFEVRERLRKAEETFRVRYRRALDLWRAGVRTVVFPFGTWMMRVVHGAATDATPLPVS